MSEIYFYIFEIGAIFAILVILFKERENKDLLETLILAILYGLILETVNVYFSKSYYYGDGFIFQIFEIPLAIGTGWAIVYYCASKLADIYNLKWWQAPFFMAVFALSFDLAIDTIATRLEFWHWKIQLNEEWFGVPYDNLLGWMAVVWTFAFFINLSKTKYFSSRISKTIKYLSIIFSPILLSLQITFFVVSAAIISGKFSVGEIVEYYKIGDFSYAYFPEVQTYKAYIFFSILFLLILSLLIIIYKSRKNIIPRFDKFSFIILLFAHLFFFIALFLIEINDKTQVLAVISCLMIIFYFIINIFPLYLSNKNRVLQRMESLYRLVFL